MSSTRAEIELSLALIELQVQAQLFKANVCCLFPFTRILIWPGNHTPRVARHDNEDEGGADPLIVGGVDGEKTGRGSGS